MIDVSRKRKEDAYMAVKRITVNVDENLLARIDSYAEFVGVTRTAAISFLCANQLFQNDAVKAMSEAVDVIHKQDTQDVQNNLL